MSYYVYAIENKVNGKLYIGVSNNPNRRYKEHLRRINGVYGCPKLGNAIAHHGADNFYIQTVYQGSKGQCIDMEIYLISTLNTLLKGYNSSQGGEGSDRLTPWNKDTKGVCRPNVTSFKKGAHVGEKHPRSKLTDRDRINIHLRYLQNEKAAKLAIEFGVNESTIHRAINFINRRKNDENKVYKKV